MLNGEQYDIKGVYGMITFAVYGHKNSGKTALISYLVRKLTGEGYKVGVFKSIHHEHFDVDVKGKDTWKHKNAGAKIVIGMSKKKTFIHYDNENDQFTEFQKLLSIMENLAKIDILFIEGFKELTKGKKDAYKIILLKEGETGESFGISKMDRVIVVEKIVSNGELDEEKMDKIFQKLKNFIEIRY